MNSSITHQKTSRMGDNFNTDANGKASGQFRDYPRRASLLDELYEPLPVLDTAIDGESLDVDGVAEAVLRSLFSALDNGDLDSCRGLFTRRRRIIGMPLR